MSSLESWVNDNDTLQRKIHIINNHYVEKSKEFKFENCSQMDWSMDSPKEKYLAN